MPFLKLLKSNSSIMKSLAKLLFIVLCSTLFTTAAHADVSIRIGRNCAKFYHQSPAKWHNNKVNLDCVSVRRIKHGPKIDGMVFFVAHTFDRKYKSAGGRIVVAVSAEEADSFARRYGKIAQYGHRRHRAIKYAPLRGVFRKLDDNTVYLDISGKSIDLVIAHRDNVRKNIIHGLNTKKRPCHCHHCKP
jgi:hypothetical protein